MIITITLAKKKLSRGQTASTNVQLLNIMHFNYLKEKDCESLLIKTRKKNPGNTKLGNTGGWV